MNNHLNPVQQLPPGNGYGDAWNNSEPRWHEEREPEIDVMEYVKLVWSHKWIVIAVLALTTTVAAVRAFTQPKMYSSTAKVAIEEAPRLSSGQFDSSMNYWQLDRYIQGQMEILHTRRLGKRVAERLGLGTEDAESMRGAAMSIVGSVNASQIENTNVMTISMVGLDPLQTAEYLNVFVEEYIAINIEDSLERTRKIYEVIMQRLDPLREKVSESELALMTFREREDALLFADEDKNVITEQVNTLTSEYARAKSERIRLETKLGALRQLTATNLDVTGFPEIMQDQTIFELRKNKNKDEVELADKLRSLKEGHPQIKELRSRISSTDKRIADHILTIRTSMQTDFDIASRRERSLFENIQQLKNQSIQLSKQTLEFDGLKREYEQNKRFYEDMMARSKEADLSSSSAVNNVRIIEMAEPASGPFSPNIRRTLMVGVALGLFLGVGLVLGLDFLDHTLRTPEQVERYVGIETVCALPEFTDDNARLMRESFQSLRTALMLASRGEGCHLLMVTSAVPGEGKTTVSFNLSKVLANGGSRVLLIDADLRKPRLHRLIQVKNMRGLTSVVLGEAEVNDVIHVITDVPNMDLMTSGPLPPNPPELYGKLTFKAMLKNAREKYDWIIIDTPPVASVTDPIICASQVDLVLQVVQYGHAKRQIVAETAKQLARTGVRIAGVVLNKVDVERDHYYYSYYYSYYRYGAYEENPKKKGISIEKKKA